MADLSRYAAKRDFDKTPEPSGADGVEAGGSIFVVQKHDATRLHYDFRIAHEGVLKSWAVTREPSADPSVKRLAVRTEDHPLAYAEFEGTIPKGSYGAGEVEIWDKGTWTPLIEPGHGFEKGHLEFTLSGARMKGRWHLVRMKQDRARKPGSRATPRGNWLLIKGEDEAAEAGDGAAAGVAEAVEEQPGPRSPVARLASLRRQASPTLRSPAFAASSGTVPAFMPPALAVSVPRTPRGDGWLHEVKLDGYRIQVATLPDRAVLRTRNGLDWSDRFPAVAAALARLGRRAVLDGEIVVEDQQGRSDFSALQRSLKGEGDQHGLAYWAFDLLELDGEDVRKLPLVERKARLEALIDGLDPAIRFSVHFDDDGALLERHACRLGLEGVISKRAADPYPSGRSGSWVKAKCRSSQEFIICGYTLQGNDRGALGALLVATGEAGALRYAGRVGTGFAGEASAELLQRLAPLRIEKPPFPAMPANERGRSVIWTRPELVVAVDFPAWTGSGLVRHAVYKGLRDDKTGEPVPRDADPAPPLPQQEAAEELQPATRTGREERSRGRWPSQRKARAGRAIVAAPDTSDAAGGPSTSPRARLKAPSRQRKGTPAMAALTHPDRVLWPESGVTKQQLADYYSAIWPWIEPHVAGRPLALLRAPDGVGGQSFFQKHAWSETESLARTLPDGSEVMSIETLEDLLMLVQFSALELHPWGATVAEPELCDQLIFDLDPGEGVDWPMLQRAALALKETLEGERLTSFAKLSGGKGIHVVAPLAKPAPWEIAKPYAHALADRMAKAEPARFLSTMSKKARTGRIFIDYLRNGRGSTAVAPYSTRARASGSLAMPISWAELAKVAGADAYRVATFDVAAFQRRSDPWASFRTTTNRLPDS